MIEYYRVLDGGPQVPTPGDIFIANDHNRAVIEASLANQSSLMANRFREQTQEPELTIKQE
eukprot:4311473-Heterocapsa_arctica.AAC.1